MGAHLSTVQAALQQQFAEHDEGGKGYLTLKEVLAFQTPYGISPCHVGVLYQIDRDRDGRFSLDELLAFAAAAHRHARAHHSLDAAYMAAGHASLAMWRDLRDDAGRTRFVDWAVRLFAAGHGAGRVGGREGPFVHRRALKAMHVLFDMERNLGIDYQGLLETMQCAAEEQGLLDPRDPEHDDWVPAEVLRLFAESLADGVGSIMEPIFPEDAELDAVLRGAEAAGGGAEAAAAAGGGDGGGASARGERGGRGQLVPPLNLAARLQLA